jgi:hypothetical protein
VAVVGSQRSATSVESTIVHGQLVSSAGSDLLMSFRATKAGTYSVHVAFIQGHGFLGLYYNDMALRSVNSLSPDEQIDFDWGRGAPISGMPSDGFGIRWLGYVMAPASTTYTFHVNSDDGAELRVGGMDGIAGYASGSKLVIDNWNRFGHKSGTVALLEGALYQLELKYMEVADFAKVSLLWGWDGLAVTVIPSDRLYRDPFPVSGTPFLLTVQPAPVCATLTTARGNALSVITAGVAQTFTIHAADAFGNDCSESKPNDFIVRLRPSGGIRDVHGAVAPATSSLSVLEGSVSAPQLESGVNITVGVIGASGLSAAYTSETAGVPANSTIQTWTPQIDFGGSALTEYPSKELAGGAAFSAKWSGAVRSGAGSVYTFHFGIGGFDERVRLWLDNVLVIDQWTSMSYVWNAYSLDGLASPCWWVSASIELPAAGTLYEIAVEYQQTEGTYRAWLQWEAQTVSRRTVETDHLVQLAAISGSPFVVARVFTQPATA